MCDGPICGISIDIEGTLRRYRLVLTQPHPRDVEYKLFEREKLGPFESVNFVTCLSFQWFPDSPWLCR
jgi:hypothetical protein